MDALQLVRDRVRRAGPIGFDEYLEIALYAPGAGFYAGGSVGPAGSGGGSGAGVGAGRGGHFLTSPELGPLFGAVLARACDAWWDELGRPDPFVVVEAAAGAGTLARAVLDAGPACLPALRYLMVERSDALRAGHAAVVPLEPAATLLGPMAGAEEDDPDGARGIPGRGPRIASLAELPAGPLTGVVLANELLDNLPFSLLERTAGGWAEVRVGEGAGPGGSLVEVVVPAPAAVAEAAGRLAPGAVPGARIPVQAQAGEWLRAALRLLHRGRVVVVDYVADTPDLASRPPAEWLRTYRLGAPGHPPLDHPGSQDVTCEVCVDQLARVRPPRVDRSQAEFLEAHGLGELVAAARAAWHAGAATGGLEALAARSRVSEAEALTDPAGLGAFRVLEWTVP